MISASNESVDAGISAALLLDDFGNDSQDIFEWILPLLLDLEPAVDPANLAAGVDAQLPTRLSDDGQSIVPGDNIFGQICRPSSRKACSKTCRQDSGNVACAIKRTDMGRLLRVHADIFYDLSPT